MDIIPCTFFLWLILLKSSPWNWVWKTINSPRSQTSSTLGPWMLFTVSLSASVLWPINLTAFWLVSLSFRSIFWHLSSSPRGFRWAWGKPQPLRQYSDKKMSVSSWLRTLDSRVLLMLVVTVESMNPTPSVRCQVRKSWLPSLPSRTTCASALILCVSPLQRLWHSASGLKQYLFSYSPRDKMIVIYQYGLPQEAQRTTLFMASKCYPATLICQSHPSILVSISFSVCLRLVFLLLICKRSDHPDNPQ